MMTKPNFIGIGVQKGGTSWLHKQFVAHPEIYVPTDRKEIHFFDIYFDRGVEWYLKFFKGATHKAIGEITPSYIYDEATAKRLHESFPDAKLLVMLRHPVERAYSHYRMTFQSGEGQKYKDFDDFMARHPHTFERGLYAKQIKRWFDFFPKEQFLFLVSEDIFKGDHETGFQQVGQFLDVDPALFDRDLATTPVGKARPAPRFPVVANIAQKARLLLRDLNLDFVASFLKKVGLTRTILGSREQAIPPLTDEVKAKWLAEYQSDIQSLEKLLDRSFSSWK